MKVRIEITKGPDRGRTFVLEANENRTIGRGDDVEIRMIDELVSREHCKVQFDGQNLTVCDLGSTNRTFVQHSPNQPQPIQPNQPCAVANGACFFVGPESRFAVVFEQEKTEASPAASPPPARQGNSNFSSSLVSPQNRHGVMGGDSSIFNLTGPVAASPGLDNVVAPHKPIIQPESDYTPPPPVAEPSVGYDAGSIVPPGEQNLASGNYREQVLDEDYVDESHLKSTPSVVERDAEEPAQPQCESPTQEAPQHNSPQHNSPLGSLVPPPAVNNPTTVEQPRAKTDTTPARAEVDRTEFQQNEPSHNPLESIATPGQAYVKSYETMPPPGSEAGPETTVDEDFPAPAQVDEEPATSRVQPNGLYFHTGQNIDSLEKIVAEISQQFVTVFCADLTRVGGDVNSAPIESALPPESTQPADGSAPAESNFELDTINEPPADNPFDSESDSAPPLKGVPLFHFLPQEIQHNGPVLLNKDEFDLSLTDNWHEDALVIFFGSDMEKMVSHLQTLTQIDIQSGRTSKGMFGFCWPMVLHATLESQPKTAVERIFGDCISCILLEDPQARFEWNLISRKDLYSEFPSLKEA